jgi:hypothetical protein
MGVGTSSTVSDRRHSVSTDHRSASTQQPPATRQAWSCEQVKSSGQRVAVTGLAVMWHTDNGRRGCCQPVVNPLAAEPERPSSADPRVAQAAAANLPADGGLRHPRVAGSVTTSPPLVDVRPWQSFLLGVDAHLRSQRDPASSLMAKPSCDAGPSPNRAPRTRRRRCQGRQPEGSSEARALTVPR